MKRNGKPLATALFALALASPLFAAGLSPLLLPCGEVRLDSAGLPALRAGLEAATNDVRSAEADSAVYVLQYDPEATFSSAVREAVAEAGATLLAPVPGGAYLARAGAAQCLAVIDSGAIAAAREYRAEDKFAALEEAPLREGGGERSEPGGERATIFVVSLFSDGDPAAACEAVAAVPDCEILDSANSTIRVRATASAVRSVAALPAVQSIGPWQEPELATSDFEIVR